MPDAASSRTRRVALLAALLAAAVFVARTVGVGSGDGRTAPERPPTREEARELPTYPAAAAIEHVGERAVVCGRVVDAAYRPDVRGRPTFLNFERPYPDQAFTVVIWEDHRPGFDRPEARLRGREVCVAGRIREHEGTPQIEAVDPGQLWERHARRTL